MAFTSWMICPKGFPSPLISIHAPRTGSDNAEDNADAPSAISIHAPRTGSDGEGTNITGSGEISIHAPRTGSDAPPP